MTELRMADVNRDAAVILCGISDVYGVDWGNAVYEYDRQRRGARPSGYGESVYELYSTWCHSLAALFEELERNKAPINPRWIKATYAMIGRSHALIRSLSAEERDAALLGPNGPEGEWRLRQLLASGRLG